MESLVSFSKWLSKWFTVAVILWAAFNYALPATSSWVIPNTAYLLGLILFGMGLTLTTEDFKRIAKRPIPVVLGTVAHYVIMPGLAWLLCMIFHLKGATAAGVILIETLSTLLAPLMIPTLLSFLAGQYVSVPAQSLFLSTLRIVVVPIILGVLVHSIFGKKIDAIIKIMPLISQAAILLIVGAVVSANHANIFTAATALVIPVVMLHNLCGYALGFGFSKILGLEEPQQKAITFEVGMQDSSLGATLAMKYFVPQAAIPSTIFSIWHNISGSILSSWWKNHSKNNQ
ncbi:MAG: bile acid:sodium symporter family protein [Streptococcus salivarius]|nr:bile acid:sodium symporter family protein [Streptococcus salivarius]